MSDEALVLISQQMTEAVNVASWYKDRYHDTEDKLIALKQQIIKISNFRSVIEEVLEGTIPAYIRPQFESLLTAVIELEEMIKSPEFNMEELTNKLSNIMESGIDLTSTP